MTKEQAGAPAPTGKETYIEVDDSDNGKALTRVTLMERSQKGAEWRAAHGGVTRGAPHATTTAAAAPVSASLSSCRHAVGCGHYRERSYERRVALVCNGCLHHVVHVRDAFFAASPLTPVMRR